jgi:hypothetical protein
VYIKIQYTPVIIKGNLIKNIEFGVLAKILETRKISLNILMEGGALIFRMHNINHIIHIIGDQIIIVFVKIILRELILSYVAAAIANKADDDNP